MKRIGSPETFSTEEYGQSFENCGTLSKCLRTALNVSDREVLVESTVNVAPEWRLLRCMVAYCEATCIINRAGSGEASVTFPYGANSISPEQCKM